jgi:multiple sugar transport system substrate-binding protein
MGRDNKKVSVYLILVFVLITFIFIIAGIFMARKTSPYKFMTGQEIASTIIEFWTIETQSDRMNTIRLLADTFNALNKGITIKPVPVDENIMSSQMAAASAAGNLPGIIEGSSELMLAFGEEGILDTRAATDIVGRIGKDRFFQGALKMVESPEPGIYYGLPFHGWVQGIWYRADWFKQAGLDPPDTWGNIIKAAERFHNPEENQYGLLIGTKPENYAEQCFTHLALSNGAAEFNSAGRLVFNSDRMLETLQFYTRLAQYNPPGPQTWRSRDYYLQGKMAMFFYSTYIMDDLTIAEVAADSLTDTNFPELKAGVFDPDLVNNTRVAATISNIKPAGYGSIVALGLIRQEDKAGGEAARKFVEFMYQHDSYITFLHMAPGGMNPMLKDITATPEYLNDPKGIFRRFGRDKIQEIMSGMDSIGSFTTVQGRTFSESGKIFAKQIIPRMIYSVAIEGKNPEEAISWAEEQMRQVIGQ